MHKVTLYVEVPDTIAPPTDWVWDNLINHEGTTDENNTPVRFVCSHVVEEGSA